MQLNYKTGISDINTHIKLYEQHCTCVCRVPFLMVGGLLVSGERTDTIDSAFFYGRAQVRKTPAVIPHYIIFFILCCLYFSCLLVYFLFKSAKDISTVTYN